MYQDFTLTLQEQIALLEDQKRDLNKTVEILEYQNDNLQYYSDETYNAYESLYGTYEDELTKPKTTIIGGEIFWNFSDSKGNNYNWSMPVETYENYVKFERYNDQLHFYNDVTDESIVVIDHTKYVIGNNFEKIIDNVYNNSIDDADFLKEVWYVVSNFSTYELDIGEYPRFALETFSRGSGDCEDTAILLAEMLRSSKNTKDWKIQLVYFDADNPQNPINVNHVAVYVSNGDWGMLVETTSDTQNYGLTAWNEYDYISGWYYDV